MPPPVSVPGEMKGCCCKRGACFSVAAALLILPAAAFGQAAAGDCQPDGAVQLSPAQMKARLRRVSRVTPSGLWRSSCITRAITVWRVGTSEDGRVTCIQLVRGHPLVAPSVLEAVRTWRFRPITMSGQRRPTVGTLVVQVSSTKRGVETSVLDEEPPTSRGPTPVQDDRK